MKSSIKKTTFQAIYRLLDKVSPINDDCGLLCGAACCTCESERGVTDKAGANDCNADFSMGLYLLPGEEKLFSGDEDWLSWGWIMAEEYEFPESWHGKVYFLQCNTAPVCDRKNDHYSAEHFLWRHTLTKMGICCLFITVVACRIHVP